MNIFEYSLRKAAELYAVYINNYTFAKNKLRDHIYRVVEEKKYEIFKRNKEYTEYIIEKLNYAGYYVIIIHAETTSRLLIETSSPFGYAIDEIGLAWDRQIDSPYIPATSIKGAFRTAMILYYYNKIMDRNPMMRENEALDIARQITNAVLGLRIDSETSITTDIKRFVRKSFISFFDAYPISSKGALLDRDVITPTYVSEGNIQPLEHKAKPTPVQFLTISPGVIFRFIVATEKKNGCLNVCEILKRLELDYDCDNYGLLIDLPVLIRDVFIKLFNEIGLGAKTSSGYGYFNFLGGSF